MTDRGATAAPPWTWPGRLHGLTEQDFEDAAIVATDGIELVQPGATLTPASRSWSRWSHAAGSHLEHNQVRLRRLLRRDPIALTNDEDPIYPIIFVSDPTTHQGDRVPVGACTVEGYIGSSWHAFSAEWAELASAGLATRRFYVSRAVIYPARFEGFISADVLMALPPSRIGKPFPT